MSPKVNPLNIEYSVGNAYSIPNYFASDLISLGEGSSSKGNQPKWATFDGKLFIKECFNYDGKVRRDDLVEVISSKYASLCTGVSAVQYRKCTVNGRRAVYSENFLGDNEQFVSFERLRKAHGTTISPYEKHSAYENYATLCKLFLEYTGIDLSLYLYKMALLDFIIANEDRHYNNFGVIYNGLTGAYREAPLFDFGLGMFEHDTIYSTLPYCKAVECINGKPFSRKSENVFKLLSANKELNEVILPKRVVLSDFEFPSIRAKKLFTERNTMLGVEVQDE